MLKELSLNIPLLKALKKIPRYIKLIKDLVAKKRVVSFKNVGGLNNCSSIISRSLVQKKGNREHSPSHAALGHLGLQERCVLGANIKLMLLVVLKYFILSPLKPMKMWLLTADRTVKKPVGISYDVFVKVDNFIFFVDFVVLDCKVNFEMPIILGRLFLAMVRALIDMEKGDRKLR